MMPWWFVSVLAVAVPVYLVWRRERNIAIAIVACLAGVVLGAVLEGMLSLMAGEASTFMDAVAKAVRFPIDFFLGLLLILGGALNPERLYLVPRIVEDFIAGAAGSDLRLLKACLLIFELVATLTVLSVAAIHEQRIVRWTAMAAGSLVITAARIGAGYLHYKDQGIVVVRNDPVWIAVAYDINWSIVALLQTFVQICVIYLILWAAIRLVRHIRPRLTGAGSAAAHPDR